MIEVTYIDHMGDDDRVADAARVSFDKLASAYSPAQNHRLIAYLAEHGHFTPFTHPQITLRIAAPIFVARQCFKSKVGFTENEISRRYVDAPPEFYLPDRWRGQAADRKQGSSKVEVYSVALADGEITSPALLVEDVYRYAREAYDALIGGGVAREQARMVLPQAMLTEWIWTGSLAAYARFCGLRLGDDAQAETAEVAWLCAGIIGRLFPVSWAALSGCQFEASEPGGRGMNIWTPEFVSEVVHRYTVIGDGPSEIARCFDLTRNQVIAKLRRLGHVRAPASSPGRPKTPRAKRGAYQALPTGTRVQQLLSALASGPKSVREIVGMTALSSAAAAQTAHLLIRRGRVERINPGATLAIYQLRGDGSPPRDPPFRGEVARAAEDAYVAARKAGASAFEASAALKLSATAAQDFEEALRYQTIAGFTADRTVPKFAHHDRHVLGVASTGRGFPSFSERRGAKDHVAVCLPLIWPEARP